MTLTVEHLREIVDYDPETGIFTRKIRTAQRNQVGDRADFLIKSGHTKGYHSFSYKNIKYLAHRVAWLYVFGEWPRQHIDHINGNKGDNRILNLRDVPLKINTQNKRAAMPFNKSGLLGAHAHQGRWRSRIHADGRCIDLGTFDTADEAHAAFVDAKRQHHPGSTL